jgi:MFS family permease
MDIVRRVFYIFVALTLLSLIADRLLFVLFPVYLLELGLSATQIGTIFSVATLALVLARTVIGKASDIFGRKRILSVSVCLARAPRQLCFH